MYPVIPLVTFYRIPREVRQSTRIWRQCCASGGRGRGVGGEGVKDQFVKQHWRGSNPSAEILLLNFRGRESLFIFFPLKGGLGGGGCGNRGDFNWWFPTWKLPKCEIFDPLYFTSIHPIWVGDSGTGENLFVLKIEADIHRLVFLAHAECALKHFYACWVWAKKVQRMGNNQKALFYDGLHMPPLYVYVLQHKVILFSSRYLFPAKSKEHENRQYIFSMQFRSAAPPNRNTHHICV
jgi:hypothetical protein